MVAGSLTGGLTDGIGSVNLTTGAFIRLGNSGFSLFAGLFVQDTLYGFDGNGFAIVTIDTTTGAGTQVAIYSLPNNDAIDALALIPALAVPEPASVPLGLFATVVVDSFGAIRQRRRPHDHR
jgi:hypothetical protein